MNIPTPNRPRRTGMALLPMAVIFILMAAHPAFSGADDFGQALSKAALERTTHIVLYNGAYRKIAYPNGDVPAYTGVCTDVVIRSYRTLDIDLQKEVHEEMKANFKKYPNDWGLKRTDTNIDHRRVPNLRVFFSRKGKELKVSSDPKDYRPGDMVTWMLDNNRPHIGIVVDRRSEDGKRHLIVHNIGLGPQLEDVLFDFKITGHYRYMANGSSRTKPQRK